MCQGIGSETRCCKGKAAWTRTSTALAGRHKSSQQEGQDACLPGGGVRQGTDHSASAELHMPHAA